ncbi:MAG: DUF5674 family protein [Candidatus Saganbacteria bacterium]|nr:DUF5674 family protein [Candidatus Saganbacteria bacterium]
MSEKWYNYHIMIIRSKPHSEKLLKLFLKTGAFIKVAVDVERKVIAAGGELHADEEKILLEDGSKQSDLWGANYYPKEDRVEYRSMINIRPSANNFSQEIKNLEIREKVKEIIFQLLKP